MRPTVKSMTPRHVMALVGALALGLVMPGIITSTLILTLLAQALISAILATSVGFLIRQSGLVSFGQAAYFGLAAYAVALLVKHTGLPLTAVIALALMLPTLLAFILGLVLVRIPGVAFSMITLAIGQVLYEIVFKWRELANGDDGLSVRFSGDVFGISALALQKPAHMFVLAWCVLVLVIAALHLVTRSHFGKLNEAIRDNEERARFIGYQTVLPAAGMYAASAFIAACAGVLFVLYNTYVSPENLHWVLSGSALVMAIIGGTRTIVGPAMGALVLFLLKDLLGDVTEHWQGFVGLILIAVTLWMPKGIAGAAIDRLRRMLTPRGAP
jgi:branched-chain amino acid transport system permease protein